MQSSMIDEAAGLRSISPDLDLVLAGDLSLHRTFRQIRGGCFLAATFIGAMGPVDIVVTGDPCLDPKVLPKVPDTTAR